MDKTERQIKGCQLWRNNRGLGGLQYPTGFGKMYLTINFIIKRMLDKNPNIRIIIVVNTDALRSEWKLKLSQFLVDSWIEKCFKIETINYFQNKRLLHTCDLLILDEMSMYFSEDQSNIWNGNWVNFKFLLWLDATPKDKQNRDKDFYAKYPCVDKISKEEAKLNKWITESKVINIGLNFNDKELEMYMANEDIIDKHFSKFNRDFKMVQSCLRGGEVNYQGVIKLLDPWDCCKFVASLNGWLPEYSGYIKNGFPHGYSDDLKSFIKDICAIWLPEKIMGYARHYMSSIRNRMTLIFTASSKVKAVLEIINKYPELQTIVFTQRIEFANTICAAINNQSFETLAVEYHSNMISRPVRLNEFGNPTLIGGHEYDTYKSGKKKGEMKIYGKAKLKSLTLEAVRSGKARVLVAGSGLDRGLDVPKIALGIVCGFTSNKNQNDQRDGRLSRLDEDDANKEALYINLYIKSTKEEETLRYICKDINVTWIDNSIENLDKVDEYDI